MANVQKQPQNYSDFSQQSIVKTENMSFLNIMLCYYFSLEAVLQDVAKNNPIKKELDVEIQATLKHRCRLQRHIIIIDCNYKLQLLASKCQKQSLGVVL